MEVDGYWSRIPAAEDRIHRTPAGYIGVYVRMLEYGLRFPVHPFVINVLNGFNISLSQLTPLSIRRTMSYLWVCLFLGFTPDMDVFRTMFKLTPTAQAKSQGPGWWNIQDAPGFLSSFPFKSSDKDWRGQWIWVKVPSRSDHPNFYGAPRWFVRPDKKMSLLGPPSLGKTEEKQLAWFGRRVSAAAQGGFKSAKWLPWAEVIFRERFLAVVGLSRRLQGGKKLGWGR